MGVCLGNGRGDGAVFVAAHCLWSIQCCGAMKHYGAMKASHEGRLKDERTFKKGIKRFFICVLVTVCFV